MWERFCRAMDRESWLKEPAFCTNGDRHANQARLHDEIEDVLATGRGAHWVEHLNAHSVPCGPIYRVDELFEDPRFHELGLVESLREGGQEVRYLAQPVKLTRTPSAIVRPPPRAGEHTEEVLAALGFRAGEIASLRDEGVV